MKLNNLSRLTALLMAMMMLCMCSAGAETGTDWTALTADVLAQTDIIAAYIEANYCITCAESLGTESLAEWPAAGFTCLYKQLKSFTISECYDFLYGIITKCNEARENADYVTEDYYYRLYMAYVNAHNTHTIDDSYPAVICYANSCYSMWNPQKPGAANHDEACPWHAEEYTSPITTTHNVSTADALAGLTKIELTFPAAEGNLTYTWQSSATPDVENSWTNIATGNAYELKITKEALTTAYRCVVSDGTTSSPLYLGGKTFFAWLGSTQDNTLISDWMLLEKNKLEYILAAHAAFLKGIPLKEAIHVTADATTLLELFGLTTLAEIDAEGRVIDERYHIQVAVYSNGVLTPYTLQ